MRNASSRNFKKQPAFYARDVAKLFQVTPQHVYKMAAGGRLPAFRLARAIRFDSHELANWLRKAQPVAFRPKRATNSVVAHSSPIAAPKQAVVGRREHKVTTRSVLSRTFPLDVWHQNS